MNEIIKYDNQYYILSGNTADFYRQGYTEIFQIGKSDPEGCTFINLINNEGNICRGYAYSVNIIIKNLNKNN